VKQKRSRTKSEASLKAWKDPKRRKQMSKRVAKMWKNPKYRKRQLGILAKVCGKGGRKHLTRAWKSKAFRKKMHKVCSRNGKIHMKKMWADKDYVRRQRIVNTENGRRTGGIAFKRCWQDPKWAKRRTIQLGKITPPSKVQIEFRRRLRRRGFKYLRMEFPVLRYRIDIVDRKQMKGIEVDGAYWHKNGGEHREMLIKKLGWRIFRIPAILNEENLNKCASFLRYRFPREPRFPRERE
jgi:hypothetical protein